MDRYTQAVIRALKDNPFGPRNADTLYFGGGTPILLGARRLGAILEAASSQYGLSSGSEITLKPTLLHPCRAPAGAEGKGSTGFLRPQSAIPPS